MTLSDVAIRRPVFTAMMSLSLLVLGVMGLLRLGTDLYPDVSFPFVMVRTVWAGAGPEDVEEDVSRRIEDALSGISGIDELSSQSRENVSLVFVKFQLKVPMAEAVQQVRDKVGLVVGSLPQGVDQPVISQFDIAASPVLTFAASTDGQDSMALRELLDDRVRPQLEQLEGVAAVHVYGGGEREIAVELSRDRLRALGLTADAVFQKIRAEHLDLPGGHFEEGPREVGVRVRGKFKDAAELARLVVATAADGSQLRLADLGIVREAMAEQRTLVRTNGHDAVAVEVVKQSGANSAAVAESVKRLLPALEKTWKFRADVLVDQAVTIRANASEVWVAIVFGGAMAILIILLFLLDLRGTFISALALPTSVVGTLFAMWALGYSINQLTLLALSLAIGLLIDDAVVVRESITRRLEHGDDPVTAASRGTREIALAVMATTFTLCAVFVPVAFMQGLVGQFFRQFGLTITFAVLISLFVAFTLDPMLSARLSKQRLPGAQHREPALVARLRAGFEALDRLYQRTLDWVLAHRKRTFAATLLLLVATVLLAGSLGAEFMSAEDHGQIIVNLDLPPGTNAAATSARSAAAEAQVMALPGVTSVYAVIGADDDVARARWRVVLVDKGSRSLTLDDYKERIRAIVATIPQAKFAVSDPPMFEGMGDYPPIFIQVTGRDFDVLRRQTEYVRDALKSIKGTADVQIRDSPAKPELQVDVDREAAGRFGVPAGSVAMQVRLAAYGEVAGRTRQGTRDVDIRVRLAGEDRQSPETLGQMWIATPRGPVALSQIARLRSADGPATIGHLNRERVLAVSAQLAPGTALGNVVSALHEKLDAHAMPLGYRYFFKGMQEQMADMQQSMAMAMALALVFIFMVLASQFESLVHPFTIMVSLPLAIVGAVLALAATRLSLGMGANIGIILLMGLVTKNAILLVDGALQHMREGDNALEAVRKAGPRRLRPILMTSAAMVLGMLPTAVGRGVGSEFRAPMAIAVIGGVITSTLLTLWVVPVVFLWVERLRRFVRRGGRGAPRGPESVAPQASPTARAGQTTARAGDA